MSAHASISFMQEEFARALYRVALLRNPDPPGLENTVRALQNGKTFEATMHTFLSSNEFAAKYARFAQQYIRRGSQSAPAK
jgi:hypothetical protein